MKNIMIINRHMQMIASDVNDSPEVIKLKDINRRLEVIERKILGLFAVASGANNEIKGIAGTVELF